VKPNGGLHLKLQALKNNYIYPVIALLVCISTFGIGQSSSIKPSSQDQIDLDIKKIIEETEVPFQWSMADDHLIYSQLVQEDSIVAIGFQPIGTKNLKNTIHKIDIHSPEWKAAKLKVLNKVLALTKEKYGNRYTKADLMPMPENKRLPYFMIKMFDQDIISTIRKMEEVRYLEPMTYTYGIKELKSDSGCNATVQTINANDYTAVSPGAIQSWHHAEHNIPCAWSSASNQGDGIWVAVMDTGLSPTQAKLNGEFAEGESTGRQVEKYGFFNNDGVDDQCGHGTSMAGLIAAPKGFNNTPAGVAYRSNLVSYRVTEDVLLNTGAEQQGLANALTDAADDTRIKVISISLGWIFSSGVISDAVEYAYMKNKLIFAAAGTSFSLTSGYGVIFPAWMPETVAVTGINDGTGPRERCDSCHDGPETDFVVVMQRDADNDRNAITLAQPNHSRDYVSGSSAATATMAGIAALVWSNFPTMSKDDLLSRLIQTADYYPGRNSDFGYGAVDVCLAVDPNFSVPCSSLTGNNVTMQITNISFPADNDGFFDGTNEWVLSFNGQSHYYNVDSNGDSGAPDQFVDIGVCGSLTVFVPLSATSCGQSSTTIDIDLHEDDSTFANCTANGGDDYQESSTAVIDFSQNTFTHNSAAGTFTFTYVLTCTPTTTPPVAGLSVPQDTCINALAHVDFFATGGQGPYTITYNVDNGPVQSIVTMGSIASDIINTSSSGTFTYNLIDVTDVNGCSQNLTGSESVTVHPLPTISAIGTDPTTCGGTDGSIVINVTNVPDGVYDINYAGSVFSMVTITSGTGSITGLSAGNYDDLEIMANTCLSVDNTDVILSDPVSVSASIVNNSPSCIGDIIQIQASPAGQTNYEFFDDLNFNGSGGTDGSIAINVTNVPDGVYNINYAGSTFSMVTIMSGIGTIAGLSAGNYDDLEIVANNCLSLEDVDIILSDPTALTASIVNDSPTCFGDLTQIQANPAGQTNYEFFDDLNFNGIIASLLAAKSESLSPILISAIQ